MPKIIEKYTEQRQDIVNKILNILEITKENNMLSLKKLDEDIEKQKKINELVDDIKKYFICSRWTYFSNKKREFKRLYLSLIKSIMKDMQIKMVSSTLHTKTLDKTKCETFYSFEL